MREPAKAIYSGEGMVRLPTWPCGALMRSHLNCWVAELRKALRAAQLESSLINLVMAMASFRQLRELLIPERVGQSCLG